MGAQIINKGSLPKPYGKTGETGFSKINMPFFHEKYEHIRYISPYIIWGSVTYHHYSSTMFKSDASIWEDPNLRLQVKRRRRKLSKPISGSCPSIREIPWCAATLTTPFKVILQECKVRMREVLSLTLRFQTHVVKDVCWVKYLDFWLIQCKWYHWPIT